MAPKADPRGLNFLVQDEAEGGRDPEPAVQNHQSASQQQTDNLNQRAVELSKRYGDVLDQLPDLPNQRLDTPYQEAVVQIFDEAVQDYEAAIGHNQPAVQHGQPGTLAAAQHNRPAFQHNQPEVQYNQPAVQHSAANVPIQQLFQAHFSQPPQRPEPNKSFPPPRLPLECRQEFSALPIRPAITHTSFPPAANPQIGKSDLGREAWREAFGTQGPFPRGPPPGLPPLEVIKSQNQKRQAPANFDPCLLPPAPDSGLDSTDHSTQAGRNASDHGLYPPPGTISPPELSNLRYNLDGTSWFAAPTLNAPPGLSGPDNAGPPAPVLNAPPGFTAPPQYGTINARPLAPAQNPLTENPGSRSGTERNAKSDTPVYNWDFPLGLPGDDPDFQPELPSSPGYVNLDVLRRGRRVAPKRPNPFDDPHVRGLFYSKTNVNHENSIVELETKFKYDIMGEDEDHGARRTRKRQGKEKYQGEHERQDPPQTKIISEPNGRMAPLLAPFAQFLCPDVPLRLQSFKQIRASTPHTAVNPLEYAWVLFGKVGGKHRKRVSDRFKHFPVWLWEELLVWVGLCVAGEESRFVAEAME